MSVISGLKGSTTRFCVTDNAANMLKAVPIHNRKIDIGLGCFDHLLNLAVNGANLADENILEAIKVIFVTFVKYVITDFYLFPLNFSNFTCFICYFHKSVALLLDVLQASRGSDVRRENSEQQQMNSNFGTPLDKWIWVKKDSSIQISL